MDLLFLLSISTCFMFSYQLECPKCTEDCGEAGFLSCQPCQCSMSCDEWMCDTPQECVLEETCDMSGCIKMPSCIDFSNACRRGSPLFVLDYTLLCDKFIQCPPEYACSKVAFHQVSVCCPSSNFDNSEPPPPMPNAPIIPAKNEGDGDCQQCKSDSCDRCKAYPKAHCVKMECSCTSYYVDENGDLLDCSDDDYGILSPPGFFSTSSQGFRLTSTPESSTSKKKSFRPPHTQTSRGASRALSDVLLYVSIACIATLLVVIFAVISYKVYRARRRQPSPRDEEDQRKPLKISNEDKPVV